jgi:acyl carrier protein
MDHLLNLLETEIGLPITPDTPLVSSGLIDSLKFSRLLILLEECYGVPIDCRDVGTDNFDTPRQILQFLQPRPQ